jgi:SAM-dependent MidA family methyltransferase
MHAYNVCMLLDDFASAPAPIVQLISQAIQKNGGWLAFDAFMAMALYAPGLGYYSRGDDQFGRLPSSGSDFITAPELSPWFGWAVSRQVAQALRACGSTEVWEFGAGSGALAEQVLAGLLEQGIELSRYTIVDISTSLRVRQRERLASFGAVVQWAAELPERFQGVILGNEVLDAMPVQLLYFDGQCWYERGVALAPQQSVEALLEPFAWADQSTALRPPHSGPYLPGTLLEIHLQAEAFVRTLADRLERGAIFLIDYGFPGAEYYHLERTQGTLMCHRGHRSDANPLRDIGLKDITSHVNFTGIALAAQVAGLQVLGYTNQAHFLINCGLLDSLIGADARTLAPVQMLLLEHEMGELFKVIGLAKACDAAFTINPLGFTQGDRCHRL